MGRRSARLGLGDGHRDRNAGVRQPRQARRRRALHERGQLDAAASSRRRRRGACTVQGPDGPSFLLYSQSPSLLVGNGIAQAIIALDNYRKATGSSDAAALVDVAVAEARRLLPLFDTGAWSLYDRTPEPSGHRVRRSPTTSSSRGFLDKLCPVFGEPFCARGRRTSTATRPSRSQITSLRTHLQKKRKRIQAKFTISKRGSVRVTLERADGTAVRAFSGSLLRGAHTITWTLPPRGSYDLVVKTTSLNGMTSSSDAVATVTRHHRL